jgi:chromosomal replication initiator protein
MALTPELWNGVLHRLAAETPAFALDAWLRPLAARPGPDALRLVCPSDFHRERVRERFLPAIARCAAAEAGRPLAIELCVAERVGTRRNGSAACEPIRPAALAPPAPAPTPPAVRAPQPPAQLEHSFESFVVGPCNALAREASFALARGRRPGTGPLYLCGACGNGKTHLARALVREARSAGSERPVYESAESFTQRFTAAIRNRNMEAFKRRFRGDCDLLVVEDVQFLASRAATQLELFHTVTHLADAGARVVLSGDRLPRDIEGLDPRLRSQLTAGLVAEIEPPDAALRRAILRAKAAAGGVRLPPDCLDLLVDSVRGSVRDLEGALIQLVQTSALLKRPIDLELAQAALRKLAPLPPAPGRRLALDAVIDVVTAFFGVTRPALASRSRRRDVLVPRQLAMYLCRLYSDAPLSAVAREFGRDHPSVANAVRAVERALLERAPLRYQVEELCARLDRLRDAGG